jgi:zinc protease
LEKLFAAWKTGEVPKKNIGPREQAPKPVVYLVDRPGSIQSIIIAGNLAPPKSNPDETAIETVNVLLGGSFSSRVNLNLREDKHWAYGAGTFVWPARGPRAFLGYAPVQIDKTSEAMVELEKELRGILGRQPITEEELVKAQKNQTLELPGRWETIGAVGGSVGEIVRFGLPDDYFATYADKVRALTVKDLERAAEKAVHPDNLVWVVVGDREKIEPNIKKLGWGEIRRLDADPSRCWAGWEAQNSEQSAPEINQLRADAGRCEAENRR